MKLLLRSFIFCLSLMTIMGIRADGIATDHAQSQITAAAGNAVDKLMLDVLDEKIGVDLTVADFVAQTESIDKLSNLLRQSEQIGGVRWLDDQTCQIKLSIEGARVLELLRQTAELNGNKTPIPAQALVKQLKDWKARTFVATGTAISLSAAQQLRPPVASSWQQVPDDLRKQAVRDAAQNAASRAIENLKSIEYQPGQSLSSAMGNEVVQKKLQAYLSDLPLTSVQFKDDGSVETTVSIGQDGLVNAVVDALQAGSIELARDGDHVKHLRDQFDSKAGTIVGRAKLADHAGEVRPANGALMPSSPPAWVRERISVSGNASSSGSRLKTARIAEDKAFETLRGQLEALPLSANRTLGDWSKQDPAVRKVLDQVIVRAKVTRIDYQPDGSAAVKVTFDPRDLWDELRELP